VPLPDVPPSSQPVSSPRGSSSVSSWGGRSTWPSGPVRSWGDVLADRGPTAWPLVDRSSATSDVPGPDSSSASSWGGSSTVLDGWPSSPVRSWGNVLADQGATASPLADQSSTASDVLEPDPKRRALSELDHEHCFVSFALSGDDESQQREATGPTLSRPHAPALSTPEPHSMNVFVIGIGASGECGLSDLNLNVSAFCEPDPDMNKFARLAFPGAVAFNTLEEAMSDVSAIEALLVSTECVVLTLPCQNETALKDLNGYATTSTAHLFTTTQFAFVARFQPSFLLYEMTPPKSGSHTSHQDVISRLHELGYSTDTALVDASTVGDGTSHLRWFAFAVHHGPNIQGLLTPTLTCWPVPARPSLVGTSSTAITLPVVAGPSVQIWSGTVLSRSRTCPAQCSTPLRVCVTLDRRHRASPGPTSRPTGKGHSA
jgi:hypothetical protein